GEEDKLLISFFFFFRRVPASPTLRVSFLLAFLVAFFSCSCTMSGGNDSIDHTLTGIIRLHSNFHSQFLQHDRDIIVYLPPGYDRDAGARYPVLYMQDGQNLFDAATSFFPGMERHMDERAQALINDGQIEPLIIVGIYSVPQARLDEYTPTRPARMDRGGKADLYGRMLVEELKPFIDSHYRTLNGPENTGLGGSSLGGVVTMHLGLKYSNVFGKLAITSPAADWDNRVIVREVNELGSKVPVKIWLGVGTAEEAEFLESTRELH